MALESDATVEQISGRKGYSNVVTGDGSGNAVYQDISGGVEHVVGNVPEFTVYLSAQAAINVEVKVTPDNGENWYTLPESPVKFTSQGDDAVHIAYNCTHIRLNGSTADGVKVQIREVM